jgi:HEAT repeat protein
LGELATYLGRDAAAWAQLLAQNDPVQRRLAVYALGEIGPRAQPVFPALDAALQDQVNWVRVWTAAAYAKATGDRRAVALLIAEIQAPEAFVRSLVAWHLCRLGTEFPGIEAGIDALRQLLDDDDPSVRVEAALALQALQGKGSLPSGTAFLPRQG